MKSIFLFFFPSLSFLSRAVCSRRGISLPCESLAASSAKCPRGSARSQPSLLHLQVAVAQSPASSPAALKPHVCCGSFLASVAAGDARVMLCPCTLQRWEMLVSSPLFPPGLVVLPQRPQTQIVVTHRNAADRSQVRQVGRHRQHKENRVVVCLLLPSEGRQRSGRHAEPCILCACEGWSSGQWCAYFGRLALREAHPSPRTSGAQPEEVSQHGLQPSAMQRGGAVGTKCSFLSWCFPGDSSFLCCPLWDFCELRVTCAAWFGLPPPLCLGYGHFRLELLPGPRTSYLTTSCGICVLVLQDQSVSACFPCWQASRGWQKAS